MERHPTSESSKLPYIHISCESFEGWWDLNGGVSDPRRRHGLGKRMTFFPYPAYFNGIRMGGPDLSRQRAQCAVA